MTVPRRGRGVTRPHPPIAPQGDALTRLRSQLAHGVPEAAALLGISPTAVRGMIARGELRALRLGGGSERIHVLIPTASLEGWLNGGEPPAGAGGEGRP